MVIETDPVGGGGTSAPDGENGDVGDFRQRRRRRSEMTVERDTDDDMAEESGSEDGGQPQNRPTQLPVDRADPVDAGDLQQEQNRPSVQDGQQDTDPSSEVTDTGVEERSGRLGRQARRLERNLTGARAGISAEDVRVDIVERPSGQRVFRRTLTPSARRQMAASALTAAFAREQPLQQRQNRPSRTPLSDPVMPSDVELTETGAQPTEEARRERAVNQLEQQAEQQFGRDLERGEDFTVSQQGDRFDLNFTDEFLAEQAGRNIETQRGRARLESIFGPGANIAAGAAALAGVDVDIPSGEDIPRGVARSASPIDADTDLNITVDRVSEQEAQALDFIEDVGQRIGVVGAEGVDTADAGDPNITVEFTEEFQEEQRQPESSGGSDMGVLESVAQPVIGPPGELEQAAGFVATDPVGAVTGPPGTLESEIGYAVSDPVGAVTGPPGSIESAAGDVAYDIRDASASAAAAATPIASDIGGDILNTNVQYLEFAYPLSSQFLQPGALEEAAAAGGDIFRGEADEQGPESAAETFGEGIATGVVGGTVGLPQGVVDIGGTAADAAEFTAAEIEEQGPIGGAETSLFVGGTVAAATTRDIVQQARQSPVRFAGTLTGGAAIGTATTPLRFSRVYIPRAEGIPTTRLPRPTRGSIDVDTPDIDTGISLTRPSLSGDGVDLGVSLSRPSVSSRGGINLERPGLTRPEATALRGVRLETPLALRPFIGDRNIRGTTVAGFRGARPTTGTPTVDVDTVDFARMGAGRAQSGPVFEPQSVFEADVFTTSARGAAGDIRERLSAGTDLLDEAETIGGRARAGDLEPLEDVIRATEDISADVDAAELAEALGDVDATIYGSGAVRAQAPEFRDPRDLDIIVPEKQLAKERIGDVLEGTGTDIGDFDIKLAEDFGGLEAGEIFGYGRRSQAPIETPEGVRINPIGEELQRKGGASMFFRGPEVGSEGVDIGPRPVRGPDTRIRQKDVFDTAAIGRELLGESESVTEFERAFGLVDDVDTTPSTNILDVDVPEIPTGIQAFRQDTRAQLGPSRRPPRDVDVDTDVEVDTTVRTAESRVSQDVDVESPRTRRGIDDGSSPPGSVTPSGALSPGVGVGSPVGSPTTGESLAPSSPVSTAPSSVPVGVSPTSPSLESSITSTSPSITSPSIESTSPSVASTSPSVSSSPPSLTLPPSGSSVVGGGLNIPTTAPTGTGVGSEKEEEEVISLDKPFGDFLEEYEYGVADPGDVLRGEGL